MCTRIIALGRRPTHARPQRAQLEDMRHRERNTIVTVRVAAVRAGAPTGALRECRVNSVFYKQCTSRANPHADGARHKTAALFSPDNSHLAALSHTSASRPPSSTISPLERSNANNDRPVSQLTPHTHAREQHCESARLTGEAVTGIHFYAIRDAHT